MKRLADDLREKIDNLCYIYDNPHLFVTDYAIRLRNEIDLDAERILNENSSDEEDSKNEKENAEINKIRTEYIRIVNEFELSLHDQMPAIVNTSALEYASLIDSVDMFERNKDETIAAEDSYTEMALKIINETNELERLLLGNQTMKYVRQQSLTYCIGFLIYLPENHLTKYELECLK